MFRPTNLFVELSCRQPELGCQELSSVEPSNKGSTSACFVTPVSQSTDKLEPVLNRDMTTPSAQNLNPSIDGHKQNNKPCDTEKTDDQSAISKEVDCDTRVHENPERNKSYTKYIPLLPKPGVVNSVTQVCGLHGCGNTALRSQGMEKGTQTDTLGTAIRSSDIILEDQCTSTTLDYFPVIQSHVPVIDPRQFMMSMQLPATANPFNSFEQNDSTFQQWNAPSYASHNPIPNVQSFYNHLGSGTSPDLSTQTLPFGRVVSRPTSISNLGTQTVFPGLMETVNRSSSSIELQCELGDASLQLTGTEGCGVSAVEEVISHGTQTSFLPGSQPTNEPMGSQCVGTDMSSFGTQTASAQAGKDLTVEQSFPLQHSTSDFAMQFPYELMDFGTQTPLPDSADEFSTEFLFDDGMLDDPSAGAGAQLSQSSTQTELDFLFNNIETQTDWQV